MSNWIAKLCQHVGIQAQYRGFEGQTVHVTPDTQLAVLRALEIDVSTPAQAQDALRTLRADAADCPAPQEIITQAGKVTEIPLTRPVDWALTAEGGTQPLQNGAASAQITLPPLPLGIHKLSLQTATTAFTTWVLARPDRAVKLEDRLETPRIWGVLAALYGLTDGDAVPIGSYGHLGRYAAAMAGQGADFIGINPVHAMGQTRPEGVVSPYSPSHRAFLNTWHCAAPAGSVCQADLIDYPTALRATGRAIDAQFAAFSALAEGHPDRMAFAAFRAASGDPLQDFALFEALATRFGADWRSWPAPYRNRDATALAEAGAVHADQIRRTAFAQWQAERQLGQAQSTARDAGMRIGLYLDLAVGPRLGGAETWDKDTSLITGATLGAPPDPLGPEGQSWGLAPQSPLRCRAQGYRGFARLLRAIMRHSGMIRIDHVLGLMRSFWIPEGHRDGTYVSYPFEALLAVVAIESVRSDTIVVGEDLGLVPEGLRDRLAASGIYGMDVLQYMRSPDGGFRDTAEARALALCAFATHDTPTVAGFFAAEDACTRAGFGGIDADTLAQTRADRKRARVSLGACDPVPEVHRRLACARSAMVAVQLDDLAEQRAQQNLPGTVDEYPNWRLKAPFTVEALASSDAFARLGAEMQAQNRANPNRMERDNDLQDCSDHSH